MHDSCCGDSTHAADTAADTADSVLSDIAQATASVAGSMHCHHDAPLPSTRGSFKLPCSSYGGSQDSRRWWGRRLHLSQQHQAEGSHGNASGVEIPTHGQLQLQQHPMHQHQLQQKGPPEVQPCVRSVRSMSCSGYAVGTHVGEYLQRSDAAPVGQEAITPDADSGPVSWSGGECVTSEALVNNHAARCLTRLTNGPNKKRSYETR